MIMTLSTIYLQYNDLVQLEVERRTDLKWNYLLERCKFYVKVSFVGCTTIHQKPFHQYDFWLHTPFWLMQLFVEYDVWSKK